MLSPKPWRAERVIWLFAALLACLALGTIVVQGYLWLTVKEGEEGVKPQPNVWIMLLGTMMSHGIALVLVGVFLREHQLTWREAFGIKSQHLARTFVLAILTTAIVLPIAWKLAELCKFTVERLTAKPAVLQQAVVMLQQSISLPLQIYYAFVAVLLAPIIEEIIFRGVLYPAIKQAGYVRMAAWASSILFAWSHVNLMTFIPLLFLGFVLTLLYETTDNLLAPILAHSLFNATNFWLIQNQPQ